MLLVGAEGPPPAVRDRIVVQKIRPDGSWAWSVIRDAPAADFALASGIAVDFEGNVFISAIAGQQGSAFTTMKFDGATGAKLWERFPTPSATISYGLAIAVDSAGDVFAAGTELRHFPGPAPFDLLVVKYQGQSGQELWRTTYESIDSSDLAAIAIDANDDAMLTGWVTGTNGQEFVTAKIGGKTGQQVWARSLPGENAAANYDVVDLSVDAAGDAIVTGSVTTAGLLGDVVTIKYSGIDGATLWERRFDGAEHDNDFGSALVIDHTGDISVAGRTTGAVTGHNFLTLRYRADGTLLWSRQFHSSGANNESVEAMTHDVHGNVYVTGTMLNADGNLDFMTIGYAAETGRERMRVQFDYGNGLHEEPGEVKWSPDGSLWVAGEVPTPEGHTIGVMKIIVPMFADAFEAEVE